MSSKIFGIWSFVINTLIPFFFIFEKENTNINCKYPHVKHVIINEHNETFLP